MEHNLENTARLLFESEETDKLPYTEPKITLLTTLTADGKPFIEVTEGRFGCTTCTGAS